MHLTKYEKMISKGTGVILAEKTKRKGRSSAADHSCLLFLM